MTTDNVQTDQQAEDIFSALYPYQFMVLTTFRKSGEAVPTTVWFAPDNGRLYVTTMAGAGKIKRIRHHGRVMLAPSDARGTILDHHVHIEAYAHVVHSAEEHEHALAALRRKYGAQFDAVVANTPATGERTYIEIEPAKKKASP